MNVMEIRTKDNVNLIWKHTHSDYRGSCSEEKSIMYADSKGLTSGAIADLPPKIFASKLASARRSEIKEQRDRKLKPIYVKFGLEGFFNSTNQWREDMKIVELVFNKNLQFSEALKAINAIKEIHVVFPDGPDSDGIEIIDGVQEVEQACTGALEVNIIRPSSTITRYFCCDTASFQSMFNSILNNPNVKTFCIV